MRKRISRTGIKIRKTRRENDIKRFLGERKMSADDRNNVYDLLSKNLTTKRGIERSKRLQKLIFDDSNPNKLKRFKEFSGLKNIEASQISKRDLIKSIGNKNYNFYKENINLIKSYNKNYKILKKEYGAGFANKKHGNYSYEGSVKLNKKTDTIDLIKKWTKHSREKQDTYKGQ